MPATDMELFVRLFRKYRLLLLAILLISGLYTAYYFKPRIMRYQGAAVFYVTPDPRFPNEVPYKSMEGTSNRWQVTRSHERVLQFAFSGKMQEHLIQTYDLYKHYGIDTLSEGYRERMYGMLNSRIEIFKINPDIFRVTISDRNNEIAAAMANSVVLFLDRMNKEYIYNNLQKELRTYKKFIDESERRIDLQHARIDSTVSELKRMTGSASGNYKSEIQQAGEALRDAGSQIADLAEGEMNTYFIYNDILRASDFNKNTSVVLIRKALPETSSKKYFLILYAGIGGLLITFLAFTVIYFFNFYKDLLIKLFGK